MRDRWKRLLLSLAIAVILPSVSSGQLGSVRSGFAFGPCFPSGQLTRQHEGGLHLSALLEARAPDEDVSLRGELLYQRIEGQSGGGAVQSLGLIANAVFDMPRYTPHPYFIAGMGAYRVTGSPVKAGFSRAFGVATASGV